MKRNLSKVLGILAVALSLTGLTACLVHFSNNDAKTLSGLSSSTSSSTSSDNNTFVEGDAAYKFEDGHSYRIPLDKLCYFYDKLGAKTFELNDGFYYETLMNFDFSEMTQELIGNDEWKFWISRFDEFPLWFDGYIVSNTSEAFNEEYLSWVGFYDGCKVRFKDLIEAFVRKVSSFDLFYHEGSWDKPYPPRPLQIYKPLYSTCSFSLEDDIYEDSEELIYQMILKIKINIPSENLEEFYSNYENLTYLEEAFGNTSYPLESNNDGSVTWNFTVNLGNTFDRTLNGSFEGFVFNKSAQIHINEQWADDIFNAWMYANLYAEEMNV